MAIGVGFLIYRVFSRGQRSGDGAGVTDFVNA